jgi:hypothetical protein
MVSPIKHAHYLCDVLQKIKNYEPLIALTTEEFGEIMVKVPLGCRNPDGRT